MDATKKTPSEGLRRNEEKWTKEVMAAGWTAFPTVVLERQKALGLDAMDLNILFHLARYWWTRDNPPHPSKRAIAECMGVNVSTIRRRIQAMEREGLLKRVGRQRVDGGQETNHYLFDGLIKAARPLAHEVVEERTRRRTEDDARRLRKKPRLALLKETA